VRDLQAQNFAKALLK